MAYIAVILEAGDVLFDYWTLHTVTETNGLVSKSGKRILVLLVALGHHRGAPGSTEMNLQYVLHAADAIMTLPPPNICDFIQNMDLPEATTFVGRGYVK
jgi:hypothetical protein